MRRSTSFKGEDLDLSGNQLEVGSDVPQFKLTGVDMNDVTNEHFEGNRIVIVTVPSLDTPVCDMEVKRFNIEAENLDLNTRIMVVSRDLPFAQQRWCGSEGVNNVLTASDYKYRSFSDAFGVLINDWQLLSRAVFVCEPDGKISYVEYVPEISIEPDYQAVLDALSA